MNACWAAAAGSGRSLTCVADTPLELLRRHHLPQHAQVLHQVQHIEQEALHADARQEDGLQLAQGGGWGRQLRWQLRGLHVQRRALSLSLTLLAQMKNMIV